MCGGELLPIRYGEPGPDIMEAARRGLIVLGGCIVSAGDPDLQCAECDERFRANGDAEGM